MRRAGRRLLASALAAVFLAGCPRHVELRPPDGPEILASPDDKDKRYTLPCSFPTYAFDNDPLRQKNKSDGVIPARGGPRPPGMTGSMNGPGY